jgi:hypothetical protein
MFKKIVEFFTGKKPESNYAHPLDAVTTPNVSASYKLEPPVATTPIPYVPEPPTATTPVPVTVEPPAAPEKKKRTFVKKPAVIKAPAEKKPAKPRAKKTSQ